jgi:hypothetical protein
MIMDEVFRRAEAEGRDPNEAEQKMYADAVAAMEALQPKFDLYTRSLEVTNQSRAKAAQLAAAIRAQDRPNQAAAEYRSAGAYVFDCVRSIRGDRGAADRLDVYNRVAAHQTTTNAAGIVPTPIVGDLINFIDTARPLVSALGPRPLEGGPNFWRPRVTTHTTVGKQTAEKAEFSSQAMVIDKLTGTVDTYGGYVNVSRQLIDWSTPAAMDIITQDLAGVYAQNTELNACITFQTAATAGTVLPTGTNTADAVAAAVWAAVGAIYGTVKGVGRIIGVASPAMLGFVGPAFAPINPTNAQGQGFQSVNFGSGLMGSIGGVPIYVSPGVTGNTLLVMSSAAAEVYDQTVGLLSVTEPSVGGVQVAYMGYFSPLVVAAGGIIKITKTP